MVKLLVDGHLIDNLCPFDGLECHVPPEKWIFDGPACDGVHFFGSWASNGVDEQVVPSCPRLVAAGGVAKFVDKKTGKIISAVEYARRGGR